jgi:predicted transport protein
LDESDCPVIIEYKKDLNENVINQGLFYLNWLMDHKAEYKLLVLEKYGKDAADAIDWSAPRLLCIAGNFTKYDEHAIQQMSGNIELIRYRRYGDDLLLLELVSATSGPAVLTARASSHAKAAGAKAHEHEPSGDEQDQAAASKPGVLQRLDLCADAVRDRFEALRASLLAMGDVQERTNKGNISFRRLKVFAYVWFPARADRFFVYVNVPPDTVQLEPGFASDMRSERGWTGPWQLELTIDSDDDLERAKPLILKSYEAS